jgi:hypothetical protein
MKETKGGVGEQKGWGWRWWGINVQHTANSIQTNKSSSECVKEEPSWSQLLVTAGSYRDRILLVLTGRVLIVFVYFRLLIIVLYLD